MNFKERVTAREASSIQVASLRETAEVLRVCGRFHAECFDADGRLKWSDDYDNVVTDLGAKALEDTWFQASAYTQVGPYMGLISSASWSAVAAADTMASHGGWLEAGSTNAPTFAARLIMNSWSAASGAGAGNRIKATNSAVSFTMTGAGTLKGSFMVLASGAVATLMNTSGTLFSAGTFSGGDKVVASTDVVNVSWSFSI